MKAGIKRKFRASIRLSFHPEIHPDDAEKALRAWFWRTAKSRKKPSPEAILEDGFLSSFANMPPDWWDADQKQTILARLTNKDFCERLARAMAEGRARMFDAVDIFILRNWRVLRHPDYAKLPGLRDWCPKAACALMKHLGLSARDEGWYSKRRERLGQAGKRRYRVWECIPLSDGRAQIEWD